MNSTLTAALAGLLLAGAAGLGGYAYGLGQGRALQRGQHDAQALGAISAQLAQHAELVKRSGAASRSLRAAVAQLEKTNTETTTEIAHALATTASERAGCVLPPDVMRGLQRARERASAAAAGGIHAALPAAASGAAGPADGRAGP